jgi:hypothetical protein
VSAGVFQPANNSILHSIDKVNEMSALIRSQSGRLRNGKAFGAGIEPMILINNVWQFGS